MPKAVLTTGTPVAATTPLTPDDMATRLRTMGLSEESIAAAVAAAGAKGAVPRNAPMKPVAPATVAPVVATTVVKPAVVKKTVVKPAPVVVEDDIPMDDPVPVPTGAVLHSDAEQSQADDDPSGEPIGFAPAVVAGADDVPHDEEAPPTKLADNAGGHSPALINQWSRASHGAMVGAFDRSDFSTPQLKIVQGKGENSQRWNEGTLVFIDQELLPPCTPDKPSKPFNFIPATVQKYFREVLEEGSTEKPRNAGTPEEVAALGGTTEWTNSPNGERLKPTWSPAARWTLIIEKPEGVEHPGFSIALEINKVTRYFAACVYYVNGTAYRSFSKPIIDATNFILKIGDDIVLHKRFWKFQVVKEKSGNWTVFAPRISLINELTPPDLVSLAESLRT